MKKSDLFILITLIALGVLFRVFRINFGFPPNFEVVTAFSLVGTTFLKNKKLGFLISFLIMLLTDFFIGNTIIFLFTWSGFLFPWIISFFANRNLIKLISLGIISNLVFFFWTNLGVVLTTTMYEKSLEGLIRSYYMGLPFLLNQIVSGLIFIPLTYFLFKLSFLLQSRQKLQSPQL